MRQIILFVTILCTLGCSAFGDEGDEGLNFVKLFNDKDLTGWVPVNVAPKTFTVVDGIIHNTGVPTGVMRTEKQYENFVIELDWMHEKPAGNSGLFVWGAPMTAQGTPFAKGIEVQILDEAFVQGEAKEKNWYTGQGDIFAIHGATMHPDRPHPLGWERCLPSENRTNPAGQWNHYRVEAKDGVIKLAVNGKVVSGGSQCRPRKGYLCLEAEGSPAQFKNIRIAELPSTNPKPEECQPEADGSKTMYTGVDLVGWKDIPGQKGHWKPDNWILHFDGKSDADAKTLWTEKDYGDFTFSTDWRLDADPAKDKGPYTGRIGLALRGKDGPKLMFGETAGEKPPGQWNRTIVTLNKNHLTVVLNGKTIVDEPRTGVPDSGPIGLLADDHPVEFASLFIREIK